MTFKELGLNDQLVEAISYMGFEQATPIQEQGIPLILSGRDLIGCAQTGTGKTAAFVLPILQKLSENANHHVKALIVVPTREIALQIDHQIQAFAYFTGLSSFAVYGGGDGSDWDAQKNALVKGTDIVIATPGKLISHINMGNVNFDELEYLILDEADRMLDIGFHDDIVKIISYLPKVRQNLMFSATMPSKIRSFSRRILNNPAEISLEISKPAEGVLQGIYPVFDHQKIELVTHLINDKPNYKSILIFSSTKKMISQIVRALQRAGFNVAGISSDLDQKERERVLSKFKSKQTRVLIATDVLSRGIDIKDINLVINFDVPGDAEDYVHRVGRTARADTTGVALTFVNEEDAYKLDKIEKLIDREIIKLKLPSFLGPSPDLSKKSYRKPYRSGPRNKYRKKR